MKPLIFSCTHMLGAVDTFLRAVPEPCLRAASESDGRRNQSRCFSDTFDWINNDEQIALGTEGIKAGTGLRFPFPSLVSAPASLIDSYTARGAQLCKCLCFLHCSPRCWGSLCQPGGGWWGRGHWGAGIASEPWGHSGLLLTSRHLLKLAALPCCYGLVVTYPKGDLPLAPGRSRYGP